MNSNILKLKPSKMECMAFGSAAMGKRLKPLLPIHILAERFEAAELVQNLGVISCRLTILVLCTRIIILLFSFIIYFSSISHSGRFPIVFARVLLATWSSMQWILYRQI